MNREWGERVALENSIASGSWVTWFTKNFSCVNSMQKNTFWPFILPIMFASKWSWLFCSLCLSLRQQISFSTSHPHKSVMIVSGTQRFRLPLFLDLATTSTMFVSTSTSLVIAPLEALPAISENKCMKVYVCFLISWIFLLSEITRIETTLFRSHSFQVPLGTTVMWLTVPITNSSHNLHITFNETVVLHTGVQPWNFTFWYTFSQPGVYHFVDMVNTSIQGFITVARKSSIILLIPRPGVFQRSFLLSNKEASRDGN